MPHITLEYTTNVETPDSFRPLLLQIHRQVNLITGVDIGNCKSRVRPADNFLIGEDGTDLSFIHLQVRFIEGRNAQSKQQLGSVLCELLQSYFSIDPASTNTQITVEIGDIRLNEYTKFPSGTLTRQ